MVSEQEENRKRILHAALCNVPTKQIAETFGVDPTTVRRVAAKGTASRKKGSGRKNEVPQRVRIRVKRALKDKPGGSLRAVVKGIVEGGEQTSRSAIQRWVKKQPWGVARKVVFCPKLTVKNKNDRMAFCAFVEQVGADELATVTLFTDEAPVYLHPTPNNQNFRVYTSDPNNARMPKWKGNGTKLNVAAGICAFGMTDLLIYTDNLTAGVYTSQLLPFYLAQAKKLFPAHIFPSVRLQEDGHTAHSAKVSCTWRRTHWPNCELCPRTTECDGKFMWPGNSPDLNPIEPIWGMLQSSMFQLPVPTDTEEMRVRLLSKWEEMRQNGAHSRLIASFNDRIQACKAAQGGNTTY